MEWRDEGLVVGARKYGESSVILELMTRAHGRHFGLLRGSRSSRGRGGAPQQGDLVVALWRARLEGHMGAYAIEPTKSRAARLIDHAFALHGAAYLSVLLRLLPERDPHENLFLLADELAEAMTDRARAAPLLARFELAILAALGFGLDLDACALTGARDDLAFISPRTGRAASRVAGAPWADRLFAYPRFLQEEAFAPPDAQALAAAFKITAHFLTRDVFEPRGAAMPPPRASFLSLAVGGDESERMTSL